MSCARDLTRVEAANAASYAPGQRVTFRRGSREQRLSKGIGYTVEAVDADAGTVALVSPKGRKITWSPGRWGGEQAAFDEVPIELRTGDQVQFTRNNRHAGRNNGDIAAVRAIDPNSRTVIVQKADGSQQTVDLSRLADRHIRHGWVRTIHAAQGSTADRVIAHLESFRANTADAASAYVAISRARDHVALIPTAGTSSPRCWDCATAQMSGRSMKCWCVQEP